ncbi:MAG: sigma-70 family RNA polymerase sigma factor [Symbiobacteriia bacterium]
MGLDEGALVARACQGEVEAFEQLVAAYERKVYNLAYRLTGSPDDAADVAQEALLKVYTSLPEFRGDSSFSTWLYRVVSNTCLDELRRRKRQRAVSLDQPLTLVDGEDLSRQWADDSDGPEEILTRKEQRALVQQAITLLDEEHRVIIVMRDIQGLSYQEVADSLGLSLGTVKSRLNRARAALQKKFSELELFGPKVVRRVQGR